MFEFTVENRPFRTSLSRLSPAPGRRPRRELYAEGGIEPRLEDLLADPLTAAVMRRDGVSVDMLRQLISETRDTLRQRLVA